MAATAKLIPHTVRSHDASLVLWASTALTSSFPNLSDADANWLITHVTQIPIYY